MTRDDDISQTQAAAAAAAQTAAAADFSNSQAQVPFISPSMAQGDGSIVSPQQPFAAATTAIPVRWWTTPPAWDWRKYDIFHTDYFQRTVPHDHPTAVDFSPFFV